MKQIKHFILTVLTIWFIGAFQSEAVAQRDPLDDGVMRILAIGNSFSEDAIENYLYDLAKTEGRSMVIGNLYIGGAPLTLHLQNMEQNKGAYSYRKTDENGQKVTTEGVRIADALINEKWDYISFQQASPLSGMYESYAASLPKLFEYVRQKVQYPSTKYILHQTWAYQQDSQHGGFVNYDKDQSEMYKAIVETSKQAFKLVPFQLLVPAGTAVQNARTSFIGDHFTRDGYHLQLDYGRFTAACTWYEILFGGDVRRNKYKPLSVTGIQSEIAKEAAHQAVQYPFAVTPMKAFQILDPAQ